MTGVLFGFQEVERHKKDPPPKWHELPKAGSKSYLLPVLQCPKLSPEKILMFAE